MTDERSPEERRLSKFSNADRGAYRASEARETEGAETARGQPLEGLIEHVMRDKGLHAALNDRASPADSPSWEPETGRAGAASSKLIEELEAAQGQKWIDPDEEAAQAPMASQSRLDETSHSAVAPFTLGQRIGRPLSNGLRRMFDKAGMAFARAGLSASRYLLRLSRRMKPSDWRRRYLALLSTLHRRVFDRRTEQLLFSKTPPLQVYRITDTETGQKKEFVYGGPIPGKVLGWALSGVPSDLKRYAFVDFRSGNGRTLLLAARRNFEFAAGYAFGAESCEALEMNLAQYPRSYMSCRDVRALRGDRDGIFIPRQPAVLFFPHSLSLSHIDIILNKVGESFRLHPRPIFLVFDNAGRERALEAVKLFERVSLPLLDRIKAGLFSPARVAVYRAPYSAGAG
jgi:hypothetical protein